MRVDEQEEDVTGGSGSLSRRSFLGRGLAAGAAISLPRLPGALAASRSSGARCTVPSFRTSLSVSPFTEAVLKQVSLKDGKLTAKSVAEVQRLYFADAATEIYQRVATLKLAATGDGECGWALGLERARLARDLGVPFNPELGLWAVYGDASAYQQPPDFSDYPSIRLPGPWISLTLAQMEVALRQYGALVARQVLATGVRVNYWDLGNEVDSGIAGVTVMPFFPDTTYQAPNAVDPAIGTMTTYELITMPESERIAWSQAHLWPYVGKLLLATAEGIRSVDRSARFSTHISHFGNKTPAVQIAFWESVTGVGYLPDQLGTSYYPTEGKTTDGPIDTWAWLKQTAAALTRAHKRQMFIAEYGYPSAVMQPPYIFNDAVNGYPLTPQGQHDFTRDLVEWGYTSGQLAGIRPWAPDYCTNPGWAPMGWFDVSGTTATAKPALHAINEALAGHPCATPTGHLVVHVERTSDGRGGLVVLLRASAGAFDGLTVQLLRGRHVVATRRVRRVGTASLQIVLKPHERRLRAGVYTLTVRRAGRMLVVRKVRVS
jgi:hypothetical protein